MPHCTSCGSVENCLNDPTITKLLKNISAERIREELDKCFKFDFHKTIKFLQEYPLLWDEFFNDRTKIWLKPTMEEK
jgi:Probable RNA and SrmB- binding site of polymerase A